MFRRSHQQIRLKRGHPCTFRIQPFEVEEMRGQIVAVLVFAGILTWVTGCKKQIDQAESKSGINNSFAGRHESICPQAIKLPPQAAPSKDEKTRDYATLTDAGLLVRGVAEK